MTYTKHGALNDNKTVDNARNGGTKNDNTDAGMESENLEEKESENVTYMEQPRDHGYSWVVLIGGILEMALLIGMLKSSGLIFVAFQDKFKSSSSMTSLPSTVQNIVFSIMALFVLNIGLKLTTSRNLVMIGSVIICISYVVTSQATDVRVLLFSHGILHGIAMAFLQPTTVVTVSQYFNKRRGFANSLAVSGSCVGGLIYAPLITKLLQWYGYEGCFMIIGGILLNGCVCGALFRPISFYTKRRCKKRIEKNGDFQENQTLINNVTENGKCLTKIDLGQYEKPSIIIERIGIDHQLISSTRSLDFRGDIEIGQTTRRKRAVTYNEQTDGKLPFSVLNGKQEHYSSSGFISSSLYDILSAGAFNTDSHHNETNNSGDTQKQDENDVGWLRTFVNLFDYKLFKEPVFVAFLIAASCTCPSTVMVTIYIAPHAKDLGVSTEAVAELVLVYTAVDLVARVVLGYISDKGWLRRSTLISITTMLVSISAHLLRFYTSYSILIVFAVILGLVSGLYFSIYPVVLTDYMSLDRLKSCLGFTALVHGFSVAGTFFLVGYLRDVSGSYVVPYHFIGAQAFIGAAVMFSLPFIERYQNSKIKDREINLPET